MFQWIATNLATLIGAFLIAVVFVAIVYHEIKKRRQGIHSCSCGCAGCGGQSACSCGKDFPHSERIEIK